MASAAIIARAAKPSWQKPRCGTPAAQLLHPTAPRHFAGATRALSDRTTCAGPRNRFSQDSINLPVSSELIAQYEEELQYKRLVKKFNLTKPEFIEQMNVTESPALDDARAERLWATFQEQLGRGGVQFLENGTISFSMPVTHRLSLVLPPAVCDAIEAAHAWLRGHYLQVPRMYRRRLEVRLDWAVESGAIFGLLCTLLLMLALDMGYSALCSLRMRPSAGDAATPKSKKA